MKARIACDRCYELKERCARISTTIDCPRCERLGLTCSTIRPVRPSGRRVQRQVLKPSRAGQVLSTTSIPSQSSTAEHVDTLNVGSWLQDIPGIDSEEKELLMSFLGKPENLDCYVVSSSFQVQGQRSLAAPLPAAWPVLKDAYLACARSLKMLRTGSVADDDQDIDLRQASSAMMTLTSLPVATIEDATLCLTLGAVLALFVYSAIGVGVADICNYCLSITRPFLDTTEPDNDTTSQQSFLALLEIMDCMVHRREPTLRIQVRNPESVDRHLGLCLPLLPYFHDLCTISSSQYSQRPRTADDTTSYSIHIQKRVLAIHAAIETWQPSTANNNLMTRFDTAEVIKLLTQARVYRLAGLLVSHRLQYPFGQRDSQADIWSREVLRELDLARSVTKQSIRCVTLPFVVAAIEIRDPSERVKALGDVDEYVDHFTPVIRNATKMFLERVWCERDVGVTSRWFDSVCKPCVVLNSIDAACFG